MDTSKVALGNSNLQVSKICFGGNVFGWTLDEKQSFEILNTFTETGFNFIDTADVYSAWVPGNAGGESETIIGKWMKERKNRHEIVLATKVGMDMGNGNKGLSAAYIKKAVDASLQRLQTDYIDLYLSHQEDLDVPVEETMQAFNDLIKAGKVRELGASNSTAKRILVSNQFAKNNNLKGYVSLQPQYNLYDREGFEKEYLELVETENLAVTPYYALASGFLTGKYRTDADVSKSIRGGGIHKNYLNDRGLRILTAMDQVAKETNAPLSEIALAWQLHKSYITAPIASATSVNQVKSLLQAASLQLTAQQVALLDQASKY
ncbi:aldo/keto reductase [Flavobacterium agricola]|uniref:Aldo/keto reductase n=1 Tax=Flavobacterium agricola TaxID=2870839 RepID=A0ABY6M3A8_9FLAO|nr:aldo/keto reductase [Flavobacterium agricola]UYW01463.1 aldo/keto reductase [Flavobacterium agricola]